MTETNVETNRGFREAITKLSHFLQILSGNHAIIAIETEISEEPRRHLNSRYRPSRRDTYLRKLRAHSKRRRAPGRGRILKIQI